jgi:hypothetical protein
MLALRLSSRRAMLAGSGGAAALAGAAVVATAADPRTSSSTMAASSQKNQPARAEGLAMAAGSSSSSESSVAAAVGTGGRSAAGGAAVPALEAAVRAGRLAGTAVAMALEYKLASNRLWAALAGDDDETSSSDDKRHQDDEGEDAEAPSSQIQRDRAHWEAEVDRRRVRFERAQEAYATTTPTTTTNSQPPLKDVHARLRAKEREKEGMNRAAAELAEAEEALERIGGSLQSRTHRRAARRLLRLCQTNGGVYIKGECTRARTHTLRSFRPESIHM